MKRFFVILVLCFLLVGVVSADTLVKTAAYNAQMYRDSVYELWANIHDASAANGGSTSLNPQLNTRSSTNEYQTLTRGFVTANLTEVPSGSTITSAYLRIVTSASGLATVDTTYGLTSLTPGNTRSYATSDYNISLYGNIMSDYIAPYSAEVGYNFTFNAAGLTYLESKIGGDAVVSPRSNWDITNGFTWASTKNNYLVIRTVGDATEAKRPTFYIFYTPAAGGDTTPPPSISNLANTTTCNSINWTWTNPGGDQNETVIWKDGVLLKNVTNTTTYDLWTGLSSSTTYIFSSKTKDIAGNLNATFYNQSATTGAPAPVASFTTQKSLYRIPGVMQVNDTSTNTPTLWNWSWGDGTWTNGTTQNATHKYTTRGQFSVTLLCSNACGSNTTPTSQSVRIVGYENNW